MPFKKGCISWNKGKKRPKHSKRMKGKNNFMYGKHHSEETIRKIKLNHKPKHHTEETKKKIRLAHKGKHRSKKTKEKIKNTLKGSCLSKKTKEKISIAHLKKWQNKEYREKHIRAILKGLSKRPTSLEKQFMNIIKLHNLPYKYVGDGDFIIGGKNPDFINVNGEKICIEVRHTNVTKYRYKITQREYERKRIEHFAKYGWKCLIFNENDLKSKRFV